MGSDEELARFRAEFGSPRPIRIGATVAYGLVFISDFLPIRARVFLVVAAFFPALLVSVWLLFRVASTSFGYQLLNPFSDLSFRIRAIWWAAFWPNPGASGKDWILFGIELAAFLGMLAGPLI